MQTRVLRNIKPSQVRRSFLVRLCRRVNIWDFFQQTWRLHTCVVQEPPKLHSLVPPQAVQRINAMPPQLPHRWSSERRRMYLPLSLGHAANCDASNGGHDMFLLKTYFILFPVGIPFLRRCGAGAAIDS